MPLLRALLTMIVAAAIVLAPTASDWATVVRGAAGPDTVVRMHDQIPAGHGMSSPAGAAKVDCAATSKAPMTMPSGYSCCDEDKACSPGFCLAKCFQFVGMTQPPPVLEWPGDALLRPTEPARPPDRSYRPQPPPPRT